MDIALTINASACALPPLADGAATPLRQAVGQDEASALALLAALPTPQLATSGPVGTQLDAWA